MTIVKIFAIVTGLWATIDLGVALKLGWFLAKP